MAILFIDSQGGVYRTDVVTGNTTRLADYSQTWTDIAVLPNGKVFACTPSGLYELNLNAGTATLRANLSGGINGLASDSQGRLYLGGSGSEIRVISSTTFNTIRTIDLPAGTSSAGDIHINGDRLYYSSTANTLLTVNLNTGAVLNTAYHGVYNLYGLHSEGGKIYGLSGNDIYLINPQTGLATLQEELPANVTIYGAATLAGVRVNGTARDDVLSADQNGSKVFGLGGSDILIGSALGDLLDGGAGRDFLHGRAGNDTLLGGFGNDVLEGGLGTDRLSGGAGRDLLAGGAGNDVLTGGADKDVFIFNAGDGSDRITDFQNNVDELEFSVALLGSGPKTVAALLNNFATNTADGVLFDFGAKGKLLVEDTTKAALADDILLV